jgi:dynein heavy chain
MVISKRGLTKCINNVGEFMSMEDFNAEAKVYNRLMEIDYFKTYKRWKNFSIWKRLTKMNRLRENIRLVDSTILISDEIIKEGINTVYLKCKDI